MDIFKAAERGMGMDDAVWTRHANRWSVWTRIPILPALALSIWARDWIGWWCLVPMGLLVAWAFINPKAFPAPSTLDHWASKGVMGERLFLARKTVPIPAHHQRAALALTWVSVSGLPPLIYGLWAYDIFAVLCGLALTVGGKIWFVDRMAWLYEEMTGLAQDQ